MATSKDEIRNGYPLPVYNFKVTFYETGLIGFSSENPISLRFVKVSGLKMERSHVVYKHGLSFVTGYNLIGAQPNTIQLTMEKGVVKAGEDLLDWYNPGYTEILDGDVKRDIKIDLCDERGIPTVTWKARGAIPISLSAPDFDSGSNDLAIETLTVEAASLSVEYHSS